MYKLSPLNWNQTKSDSVIDLNKMCAIPFDPANTDYQTFKKEVLAGAELQDADGNVMTQNKQTILLRSFHNAIDTSTRRDDTSKWAIYS